ncbi:hypothetical protein V8E36_005205 [Tilletia maclaganii]
MLAGVIKERADFPLSLCPPFLSSLALLPFPPSLQPALPRTQSGNNVPQALHPPRRPGHPPGHHPRRRHHSSSQAQSTRSRRLQELEQRRIFGSGYDLRWSACPTTDAAILANEGEFLFAWAYNATAQAKYTGNVGPVATQHPRVYVNRANEITNEGTPYGRNGYSLGDRANGSAVLVGTAYKSNFDPISLISPVLGSPNKTQAEVERQTAPYPFIFA